MAYRIDPTADVGTEVRRILSEQLSAAAAELTRPTGSGDEVGRGPDEKGVHDARKRIKKSRSLLRLARRAFGADVVRQAGDELRSCAAVLAPQREADAAAAVARHLADAVRRQGESSVGLVAGGGGADDGDVAVAAADQLVAILSERASRGGDVEALSWSMARSVGLRLERTVRWLGRVPNRAEGWDALDTGLRRQYERGRTALDAMSADPSVDELHDWRKRVKDIWYHERLLRPLWPAVLEPVEDAACRLADLLGTDHDLGLLDDALAGSDGQGAAADPVEALSGEQRSLLRAAIAVERAAILAEARWLGGRLHADAPHAWAGRHRRWWELESGE